MEHIKFIVNLKKNYVETDENNKINVLTYKKNIKTNRKKITMSKLVKKISKQRIQLLSSRM